MKSKRIIQALLNILLLLNEFSLSEIKEALSILKNESIIALLKKELKLNIDQVELITIVEQLLDNITKPNLETSTSTKKRAMSKIIAKLETTDKEKFIILSEIDRLLREKKILPKLSDLRNIATKIAKDFPNVKSRKEAIPKFMALLVEMDLAQIEEVKKLIFTEYKQTADSSDSEYQELANYIINSNISKQD